MTSYTKLLQLLKDKEYSKLEKALVENIRQEHSGIKQLKRLSEDKIVQWVLSHNTMQSLNKIYTYAIKGVIYYCFSEGHIVVGDSECDYGIESQFGKKEDLGDLIHFNIDTFNDAVRINYNEFRLAMKQHPNKVPVRIQIQVCHNNEIKCVAFNPVLLRKCLDMCKTEILYLNLSEYNRLKNSNVFKSSAFMFSEDKTKFALCLPMLLSEEMISVCYACNAKLLS